MTLFSLIIKARYDQIFHVYVTNTYSQNIEIGHGTRRDIVDEDTTEMGLIHINDEIEIWYACEDGSIVVCLRDENYNKQAEYLYAQEYVKKWDIMKPETRPWKHYFELER